MDVSAQERNDALTQPRAAFSAFPVLWLLVPLAVGIAVGDCVFPLLAGRTQWLWAAVAVALAALFALSRAKTGAFSSGAFLITIFLLFFSLGCVSIVSMQKDSAYAWPSERAVYGGIVLSQPKKSGKVVRMRVRIGEVYRGGKLGAVGQKAEITAMRTPAVDTLRPGDAVMLRGSISAPQNAGNPYEFDYASYLRHAGVSGTAFVYEDDMVPTSDDAVTRLLRGSLTLPDRIAIFGSGIRERLRGIYADAGLAGDGLALMSAMTIGDRTLISPKVREVFSDAGVSHVLALSGLHLSIIFALLQFVLTAGGRLRRAVVPAQAAILLFVWAFVVVAGVPQSLVRAAIMCSAVSLAIMARRSALSLGNLYLAALVMLVANPPSLFDVGFQMSFLSVLAILKFVKFIAPPRIVAASLAGKIWGFFAVSICAQAGVAPLTAFYFHSFPVYFMMANVVAVPLATLAVAGGVALLALHWIAPVAAALGWLLGLAMRTALMLIGYVAALPGASVTAYPSLAVVALAYAAFLLLAAAVDHHWRVFVYPAVGAMILAVGVNAVFASQERRAEGVYFYRGVSVSMVQFVLPSGHSYIYAPDAVGDSLVCRATMRLERDFWQRCGMPRPMRLANSCESGEIRRRGGMVLFGGRLYYMLDAALPYRAAPKPTSVDAAYVMRGFRGDAELWLRGLHPRLVVVDERLSDYKREEVLTACRKLGLRTYDLAEKRALKLGYGESPR